MKKWLSVVLPAALMLSVSAPALPVGAAEEGYIKKTISLYTLEDKEHPVELTCLYREELPGLPYISVEDYLDQLLTVKVKADDNGDGTFTFTNDKYQLVVDAAKDTISGDCCEAFILTNKKPISESELPAYIDSNNAYVPVGEMKGFLADLGKYQIDITADDGKVYVPFCTLSDLFSDTGCGLQKTEDGLHVVCPYDEMLSGNGHLYDEPSTRTKAEAEFLYRELCFSIDCLSGKPTLALLSESLREKGLDETLKTTNGVTAGIRELLLSESMEDYCKGMKLLDFYMDDGGHTGLCYGLSSLMKDYGITGVAAVAAEEFGGSCPNEVAEITYVEKKRQDRQTRKSSLYTEKESFLESLELIKSWDSAAFYREGDTYWFTYNSFRDSVVEPFKWSMDYAAEHNAKNFIIDLSTNGGGSNNVSAYIVSLIVGKDEHISESILSGNQFLEACRVDKNLDGQFDEQDDAVHYDFHVAMLTSQVSYSMATQMPCIAQDLGVCILGENSGGGAFNISPRFYANGAMYTTSGALALVRPNGEDVDKGAAPYFKLPGASQFYDGFYDIETINAAMDKFYGEDYDKELLSEVAESVSKAESKAAAAEREERSAFENRFTFLYWLIPCVLAAAAALVVVIVLVVRKRKKSEKS